MYNEQTLNLKVYWYKNVLDNLNIKNYLNRLRSSLNPVKRILKEKVGYHFMIKKSL